MFSKHLKQVNGPRKNIHLLGLTFVVCIASLPLNTFAQTEVARQTDASGKVIIAIFEKQASSGTTLLNDFSVEVPSDFVVVGGGVDAIEDGSLVTASYPNLDLTAWRVSTAAPPGQSSSIKAWAVGLQIKGFPRDVLMRNMAVNVTTSRNTFNGGSTASQSFPQGNEGYLLIGGGFRITPWPFINALGTGTYPVGEPMTWQAEYTAFGGIGGFRTSNQVFSIGIRDVVNGPGNVSLAVTSVRGDSLTTNHPRAAATMIPGYALVGCGARVRTTGVGNYLWKIKPFVAQNLFGCEAASQDVGTASPGSVHVFALGLLGF